MHLKTALALALTLAGATTVAARAADQAASPAPAASPAAAAPAAPAAAGPAAPDAVVKTLTAMYQVSCNAFLDPSDKNFDAAAAQLAPEFVDTDFKGKEHKRDEVIAMQKQQLKVMHATTCENTFVSTTSPDANTVLVVTTLHAEGDIQAPDGKHEFTATSKVQDTWKLVNGNWLETSSKELRNLVKVDGAVVQDEGE